MRICFLTHNLRQDNGAGVFSLRLIRGMQESLGAEVVALTTVGSDLPIDRAILYPNRFELLKAFPKIRRIIRECDIIHALDIFPYGIVAWIAGFGLGKKLIVTTVATGSLANFKNPVYAFLMRRVVRRAAAVTAISRFTAREIEKRVPGISIKVIPHGVDFDLSRFARARALRAEGKPSHYFPYILSVGLVRWRKGYHRSIEAFAQIAKKFPNLKYVIVGRYHATDYRKRLEDLIAHFGLEGRVIILDKVGEDQLAELYAGAELFCLQAQNYDNRDYEGFGLVFLEAAACGVPVVGTSQSGIEDAVEEGKNVFLVRPLDVPGFAAAMSRILEDKKLAAKMSEASLDFARRSSWEKAMAGYTEAYRSFAI
jgi:phosphatidylinositol alpha-1,6-mannosyltransferase